MCRFVGSSLEVALCGRIQPKLWALPKGGPNPSETLEETALREVREETGLEAKVVASLGHIQYWYYRAQDSVRCHKTVHFYLMSPTGGAMDQHDPEFDVVQWFPVDEALQVMSYETELSLVRKAAEMAKSQLVFQ